jgi:hypothetical protein
MIANLIARRSYPSGTLINVCMDQWTIASNKEEATKGSEEEATGEGRRSEGKEKEERTKDERTRGEGAKSKEERRKGRNKEKGRRQAGEAFLPMTMQQQAPMITTSTNLNGCRGGVKIPALAWDSCTQLLIFFVYCMGQEAILQVKSRRRQTPV